MVLAMERLHLIVHKSMIEDELTSELTPEKKRLKLREVLRRVQEIEATEKNVRYVVMDNTNPDNVDGIHQVSDICRGYSDVILYGISTTVCLPYIERRLRKKGFNVACDQRGTID